MLVSSEMEFHGEAFLHHSRWKESSDQWSRRPLNINRDSIPPIRRRPIIRREQNEQNLINLLDLHPVMQPQTKIKCKMILTDLNHVTTLDQLPSWKGRFLESTQTIPSRNQVANCRYDIPGLRINVLCEMSSLSLF